MDLELKILDSDHLCLELNVKIQAENAVVSMASLLSLNGHISSHFDTIHLKLSTYAYFALLFHSICQNMKILEINFYDVITSVLYLVR